MSYTPGPWTYDKGMSTIYGNQKRYPDDPDNSTDVPVVCLLGTMGGDDTAADRRLIAAAPDLLEALRSCLKIVDAYRKNSGGDGDMTAYNARFAIQKATGESHD